MPKEAKQTVVKVPLSWDVDYIEVVRNRSGKASEVVIKFKKLSKRTKEAKVVSSIKLMSKE